MQLKRHCHNVIFNVIVNTSYATAIIERISIIKHSSFNKLHN